jgi:pyruvate-ferredoxin/flavodoxin oxidoreductase
VATHALSIFCDHSDVMAARQTGFALLASGSVQEAHDFALIGQAASLASRIPFLHFFDGFRTSHEIQRLEELGDDDLRALIDEPLVLAHRQRALTPDHPVLRGTAQNPDAFFQAREAQNPFYDRTPEVVAEMMERFARQTGRRYRLFDYHGHPEAERVIVVMGSGAETAHETVDALVALGEKVGVLKVRLYRPFSAAALLAALPPTVRSIAALDRTKEPGAPGEPLYLDLVAALVQLRQAGESPLAADPVVVGGRYGLSSKEFTPACVRAVFDQLTAERPKNPFTVGIVDDVTHLSLPVDAGWDIEPEGRTKALFYGLGSDGTVGANKNSIKIIGGETGFFAQGYFVYDSKKAGAVTISHLRFGPQEIRSTYLIRQADFVGCHQFDFLERFDLLGGARPGGVFLLNAPYAAADVWDHLPREVQQELLDRGLDFWVIDAYRVARESGLGVRINTIMQTCFFAISGVLEREAAIAAIKRAIESSYGKRGRAVVRQNFAAVDAALAHLHRVDLTGRQVGGRPRPPIVAQEAPDFVQKITAVLLAGKGDALPVSAFPVDGTWPLATSQWEKRNIAQEIPIWDPDLCIQCNQCALVCPHATIRSKVYEPEALDGAPEGFPSRDYKAPDLDGLLYTLQVAPEDCTGCHLCVEICPAKDRSNPRRKAINMEPQREHRERERERYSFFLGLPELDRSRITRFDAKGSQFLEPLFEYSGACAGCGETPYVKLLTQLFGDRLLIANATGCSSIYGGNLPTTPYTVNADGRGPAWSNSLFEDNAEFGFGMRLAVDSHRRLAEGLLQELGAEVGEALVAELLDADQRDEAGLAAQRQRVATLGELLGGIDRPAARRLEAVADYLVKKSVWLVGGDGWAYDIGYGGLDHVVAMVRDVNILVLDTEVYSNTGGQQSKATPLGAAAKFAAAGKEIPKKDLGLEAMSYGHVYVARVAFGAKINQTVEALREADAYPGPSLVIAYSHCIAHGYDMRHGAAQQKAAVESGVWPLYRFDPRRTAAGQAPLHLDFREPRRSVEEYMQAETRFRIVEKTDPRRFRRFVARAQQQARERYSVYSQLAGITIPQPEPEGDEPAAD